MDLPPSAVFTDISVPGNVSLSWQSHTGVFYSVEQSTSLNPDWSLVASNLVATPPTNTYADYTPSGPAEFFRLQSSDRPIEPPGPEMSLFSFETGLEGWQPKSTYPVELVATNLFATDGSNSLAVVDTRPSGTTGATDWDTYYGLGADGIISNIPPVWVAISNALVDASNQWYIVADLTWNGPSIPTNPAPSYLEMQVAFNSPSDWGGWRHVYHIFDLASGAIANLIASSNSVTKTWGVPIEDTGWQATATTNSWIQIHWGTKGDWDAGDTMAAFADNWRLTTVEP